MYNFSLLGTYNIYIFLKTPTQVSCVPTVPATPVISPWKATSEKATSAGPLRSPVPIIAPPLDHVPKLPLSAETLAKIRLGKFLEREGRGREKDRLISGWRRPLSWMVESGNEDEDNDEDKFGVREEELIEWEVALGIGQRAREEVIDWILDVRLLHLFPAYPRSKSLMLFSLSRHRSCLPHFLRRKIISQHHRPVQVHRRHVPLLRLVLVLRLHRTPRRIGSPRTLSTS